MLNKYQDIYNKAEEKLDLISEMEAEGETRG